MAEKTFEVQLTESEIANLVMALAIHLEWAPPHNSRDEARSKRLKDRLNKLLNSKQ